MLCSPIESLPSLPDLELLDVLLQIVVVVAGGVFFVPAAHALKLPLPEASPLVGTLLLNENSLPKCKKCCEKNGRASFCLCHSAVCHSACVILP